MVQCSEEKHRYLVPRDEQKSSFQDLVTMCKTGSLENFSHIIILLLLCVGPLKLIIYMHHIMHDVLKLWNYSNYKYPFFSCF